MIGIEATKSQYNGNISSQYAQETRDLMLQVINLEQNGIPVTVGSYTVTSRGIFDTTGHRRTINDVCAALKTIGPAKNKALTDILKALDNASNSPEILSILQKGIVLNDIRKFEGETGDKLIKDVLSLSKAGKDYLKAIEEKAQFFRGSISGLQPSTLLEIAEAKNEVRVYDPKTQSSMSFSAAEITSLFQDADIKKLFGEKVLEIIKNDPETYAACGDRFNVLKPYLILTPDQKLIGFTGVKGKTYVGLIEKKDNKWVLDGAENVGFKIDKVKEENGGFSVVEKPVFLGSGKAHPALDINVPSYASGGTKGNDVPGGTGEITDRATLASMLWQISKDQGKTTISRSDVETMLSDKMINRDEATKLGIPEALFDLIERGGIVGGKSTENASLSELSDVYEAIKLYAKLTYPASDEVTGIALAIKDYENAKSFEMSDLRAVYDSRSSVAEEVGVKVGMTGKDLLTCFNKFNSPMKEIMVNFCTNSLHIADATIIDQGLFDKIALRSVSIILIAQMDEDSQQRILGAKGLPRFNLPITPENIFNYVLGRKPADAPAGDAGKKDMPEQTGDLPKLLAEISKNPAEDGSYDTWIENSVKALKIFRETKPKDLTSVGADKSPISWDSAYKKIVEQLISIKGNFLTRSDVKEKISSLVTELGSALQIPELYPAATKPELAAKKILVVLFVAELRKQKDDSAVEIQKFIDENIPETAWSMPAWQNTPVLKAMKAQLAIQIAEVKVKLFLNPKVEGKKFEVAKGIDISKEIGIMAAGWSVEGAFDKYEKDESGEHVIKTSRKSKLIEIASKTSLSNEEAVSIYIFNQLKSATNGKFASAAQSPAEGVEKEAVKTITKTLNTLCQEILFPRS